MIKNKINFWPLFIIIIPYLLVFKAFFLPGPLTFGDAPYFFPENLSSLLQKPLAWDFRNDNFGGPQFQVLWLYLPTFLMAVLGKLGVTADIAIRLIFYFPATILAAVGSWLFIKKFVENRLAATLGSLLYTFNTYFLLLIDGGQIGLALSYGLFPLTLYFFNKGKILLSVLTFFFLTNSDLRVAMLALLTYFLLEFNNLSKNIIYVLLLTILLDAFWIIPFIFNGFNGGTVAQLENDLPASFITILHGLTIFNPHFPQNEFGKINAIPWYFIFLPFLLFGSLLFKKRKENLLFYILFLSFVLLISAPFGPMGRVFEFLINYFPLAYAFRDSTKFFIPATLIAGILLAKTMTGFHSRLLAILVYLYLLVLIWPALLGNLSGSLSGRQFDRDYQKIYQNLQKDESFFRSVWFPERSPFGFSGLAKEGLSASELYKEIPFALNISGTYDLFNFLHDDNLTSWFEVLGIKYAFFPESPRQKDFSEKDIENRKLFLEFIDSLGFKKLDWGLHFPVYQVSTPRDKIYGQEKVAIVVGDGSFYGGRDFIKIGALFVEDGLLNPNDLLSLPEDSALLVFQNASKKDLELSFLQDFFLKKSDFISGHWGRYSPDQYLRWKYELLKNGISTDDLGFKNGLDFSSIKDEEMMYQVDVKKIDNYYLATRSLSSTDSAGLKINFASKEKIVKNTGSRFNWDFSGPIQLSPGRYTVTFKNLGGFQAINAVAFFPQADFDRALSFADKLIQKFPTFSLPDDEKKLVEEFSKLTLLKIDYQEKNPTEYLINLPRSAKWIIFSDRFSKGWKLTNAPIKSLPVYSMINGFGVGDISKRNLKLYYKPQDRVQVGMVISTITVVGLFLYCLSQLSFKSRK